LWQVGALAIGVGLVVTDYSQGPRKLTYQGISNLGGSQLVYNGELEGVTQAFEQTANTAQPGQQVRIYSDNQAGIQVKHGRSGQLRQLKELKTKGPQLF
jgi:hypothetical protein